MDVDTDNYYALYTLVHKIQKDINDDLEYEVVETISKAAENRMEELLEGLSTTKVGMKTIGLPKFFEGQYRKNHSTCNQ